MKQAIPTMIDEMRENFQLTEEIKDDSNIIHTNDEQRSLIAKDDRAIQCQRAVLINAKPTIARYKAYKVDQETRKKGLRESTPKIRRREGNKSC